MSRLRENPDRLFEAFFEIGKPETETNEPFILQKYPLDYNDEEVLKSVPQFAFPCDTERTTVDHFTFTFTDLDSKFKFGFCRHATGAQTCLCIVSFLPWFEVFYQFLNNLAEITNRSEDNNVEHMLRAAYIQDVPSPGVPVTIVAQQEMLSFKSPENKLPCIPTSRNLTEYYNAIDVGNMMMIFASMLNERRIVVTSKKLSRLTAVIHAAATLLYPMFWQHLFIPVLPAHLIDYLSAPMPFVIGVHVKIMEKVQLPDLGDAVIVDTDKNTVTTEYDDLENLPEEISSYLKKHLKGDKVKNSMQGSGDVISKTFMMSLVKLIGGYRDALKFNEGETITFSPEAFVQSRPLSMQPFLENMLHLQIFQQFINDRLDMLNCGRGFADAFEQECLLHADKLNSQTRYNEWHSKMKKQGKKLHRDGKDVWAGFKVKARPVMKEAKGYMDSMTHRVKTQGKKAYSKARTKFNDIKKPPRPTLSPDTPDLAHDRKVYPSSERSTRFVSHMDQGMRTSTDDNDLLVYSRVSCNLMSDPDIQHAMFKSASAENLPKTDPHLKASDSSGTITSSSSVDQDTEHSTVPYMDDHEDSRDAFGYTNLLDDNDSGIVMQKTNSQSSLDRSRQDRFGSNSPSFSPSNVTHTDKLSQPKPMPRKSVSPQVAAPVADRLIMGSSSSASRQRPRPAPRKQSLEESQPNTADLLISLETPTNDKESFNFSEFDNLATSGDYVVLREPKTVTRSENRRSSITRTPAMKLSQNETPKRPSIRRECSPVSPDEEPVTPKAGPSSVLDFDPLLSQSEQRQVKQTSNVQDTSDSLLKDWEIKNLATMNLGANIRPNVYNYGHPTPPPRHTTTSNRPTFYTPQNYGSNPSQGTSRALNFENPLSTGKPAPQVPPRPKERPHSTMFSGFPATQPSSKPDPFADLLGLNQSVSPTPPSSNLTAQPTPPPRPPKPNWETFE